MMPPTSPSAVVPPAASPAQPIDAIAADIVTPAIKLAGVTKRFGSVPALVDVNVDITAGQFVTLLGPSGCGKSTLLRIVAGFESPSSGTVEIDGRDMRRSPPERRPVNLVFQRYALFPHRNVIDNVLFGLESSGVRRQEARDRARAALARCRIEDLEGRRIHELSGGQAQRVAVARALVNEPKVLLLDEPLAALDLKLRRHLQFELRRLQQELETTFVYVTHDQGEALAMSDAIILMQDGQVVQMSTPRDLYDAPESVFAATFIGEANVLDCRVTALATDGVDVTVQGLVTRARASRPFTVGRSATLCLRPERIRVEPRRVAASSAGGLAVTVVGSAFEGGAVRYWLEIAGTSAGLTAVVPITPGEAAFRDGSELVASWQKADGIVLDG
jgi:ABC-type Fe3+/spermidine/putrescine transport system ATPase subunit